VPIKALDGAATFESDCILKDSLWSDGTASARRLRGPGLKPRSLTLSKTPPALETDYRHHPASEPNGSLGEAELFEGGRILSLKGAKLVDNAWSAPAPRAAAASWSNCCSTPIISSAAGVPAAAGKNTAILVNNINVGSGAAIRKTTLKIPRAQLLRTRQRRKHRDTCPGAFTLG
jgi:hypothetical protein